MEMAVGLDIFQNHLSWKSWKSIAALGTKNNSFDNIK